MHPHSVRAARLAAITVASLVLRAGDAWADGGERNGVIRFCSAAAAARYVACRNDVRAEYSSAKTRCVRSSGGRGRGREGEREACLARARDARSEALELCRDPRGSRRDLCYALR